MKARVHRTDRSMGALMPSDTDQRGAETVQSSFRDGLTHAFAFPFTSRPPCPFRHVTLYRSRRHFPPLLSCASLLFCHTYKDSYLFNRAIRMQHVNHLGAFLRFILISIVTCHPLVGTYSHQNIILGQKKDQQIVRALPGDLAVEPEDDVGDKSDIDVMAGGEGKNICLP